MLEFFAAASVIPCHDDWLNERSSTPPVSSTMHALYAAADADGLDAAADGDVLGELLAAGVLLEPHAANASAATPNTAAALSCFFTRNLLGRTRAPSRSRMRALYIYRNQTITGPSGQ